MGVEGFPVSGDRVPPAPVLDDGGCPGKLTRVRCGASTAPGMWLPAMMEWVSLVLPHKQSGNKSAHT